MELLVFDSVFCSYFYSLFYSTNCYYSLFSIGVIFDNTNKLMVDTINNIYATIQPLNNSKNNNYFTIKSYNIKQYNNIIKRIIFLHSIFLNLSMNLYMNDINMSDLIILYHHIYFYVYDIQLL